VLLEVEGVVEEVVLEVAQINCIAICNIASLVILLTIFGKSFCTESPNHYKMPFKIDPSKNNAYQALYTLNFYKFPMKTIE